MLKEGINPGNTYLATDLVLSELIKCEDSSVWCWRSICTARMLIHHCYRSNLPKSIRSFAVFPCSKKDFSTRNFWWYVWRRPGSFHPGKGFGILLYSYSYDTCGNELLIVCDGYTANFVVFSSCECFDLFYGWFHTWLHGFFQHVVLLRGQHFLCHWDGLPYFYCCW